MADTEEAPTAASQLIARFNNPSNFKNDGPTPPTGPPVKKPAAKPTPPAPPKKNVGPTKSKTPPTAPPRSANGHAHKKETLTKGVTSTAAKLSKTESSDEDDDELYTDCRGVLEERPSVRRPAHTLAKLSMPIKTPVLPTNSVKTPPKATPRAAHGETVSAEGRTYRRLLPPIEGGSPPSKPRLKPPIMDLKGFKSKAQSPTQQVPPKARPIATPPRKDPPKATPFGQTRCVGLIDDDENDIYEDVVVR